MIAIKSDDIPAGSLLLYYGGTGIWSKIIRFIQRTKYTHALIVIKKGLFSEADTTKTQGKNGVRFITSDELLLRAGGHDVFLPKKSLTDKQSISLEIMAGYFEGTPYDYKGILAEILKLRGINWLRPFRTSDAFYCSEWVYFLMYYLYAKKPKDFYRCDFARIYVKRTYAPRSLPGTFWCSKASYTILPPSK